jgi:alanine dehydrogenase
METRLIKRSDVKLLLTMEECITGVENAFRLLASGRAQAPGILGVPANDGGFHIKAGILNLGREFFVAKANANFPQNLIKNGLPTIQGVLIVSDAENGRLLALMDSMEITIIRTGAATAVAAKYFSNPDARTVTICGCGNQGAISLKALKAVRKIEKVFAYDIDEAISRKFAKALSLEYDIAIEPVSDLKHALRYSEICITCTSSTHYFIGRDDIKPGTFVAAVGSDNEEKQEIDPRLLADNKVIVDSLEQASTIGELHHAIDKRLMKPEDVYSTIGEVIAGIKPGRLSDDEIIIFDSTGIALQDVAAAAIVYDKAIERGIGTQFDFA